MARPEDVRIWLEDPLSDSPLLRGGEKLVFQRSWAGDGDARIRTEINQKLVHCLELYYVEERQAFCRTDEHGDIEDVMRVTRVEADGPGTNTVVAVRREDLQEFAAIAEMAIVTHFDFNRYKSGHAWSDVERFEKCFDDTLLYEGGVEKASGSYVIGRQIVMPAEKPIEIARRFVDRAGNRQQRSYATFMVKELRTGDRVEVSCDPSELSSYFQADSDLPHELSAAFFRAEVLSRYKTDTQKYTLTDHGEIYCRDSWRLRSYHVNDAGQVHAYLVDLNKLPHQEQLYWLSFNEWPKGDLSPRAICNDFKGEVYGEYDPLHSLKLKVEAMDTNPPPWWKPRGEELRQVVHPPLTDSVDQWADAMLYLDKLLVEGFLKNPLKLQLTELGRDCDSNWGSLTLAQECLVGSGMSVTEAKTAVAPLKQIHHLRSVVKGHDAPNKRSQAAKEARSEHGSFRGHFEVLVSRCDQALDTIDRVITPTD